MEYRRLGNSGLKVSALGFGSRVTSDKKNLDNIIQKCLEKGINYFDTAEAYGDGKLRVI